MPFDPKTLVDSHDEPFLVNHRNYRIIATNEDYYRVDCNGGDGLVGRVIDGNTFLIIDQDFGRTNRVNGYLLPRRPWVGRPWNETVSIRNGLGTDLTVD